MKRPDYQIALFDRYLAIAPRIVATPPKCAIDLETGDSPEMTAWVATLTDEQVLVALTNLAFNETADRGYGKGPQVCGWCVLAAGDTQQAADAAPTMTLAEVREHTLTCEHNPAVRKLSAIAEAMQSTDFATSEPDSDRLINACDRTRAVLAIAPFVGGAA